MPATPAELDALFAQRYSCRSFKTGQVPRDVIEAIITTARRSPSWCNAQPWQMVVTSGEETEAFRQALMAEVLSGAPKPDLPLSPQH